MAHASSAVGTLVLSPPPGPVNLSEICSLTCQLTKYLTLDTGAATRVDDTGSLGAHIASLTESQRVWPAFEAQALLTLNLRWPSACNILLLTLV